MCGVSTTYTRANDRIRNRPAASLAVARHFSPFRSKYLARPRKFAVSGKRSPGADRQARSDSWSGVTGFCSFGSVRIFGHGRPQLSGLNTTLAFPVYLSAQRQERCCRMFRGALERKERKRYFRIEAAKPFTTFRTDTWETLWRALCQPLTDISLEEAPRLSNRVYVPRRKLGMYLALRAAAFSGT